MLAYDDDIYYISKKQMIGCNITENLTPLWEISHIAKKSRKGNV